PTHTPPLSLPDALPIYKTRPKGTGTVEAREVIGDVEGRRCVLTDDMIDTAGTIVAAAEILKARGATEVWAMATHGLLSGPAIDRDRKSTRLNPVTVKSR